MSIGLMMIGDGRDDYHDRSRESLIEHIGLDAFDAVVEIDDRRHYLGFAGAIQRAWDVMLDEDVDWIFHLELDFTFHGPVPLPGMIDVLADHEELAQIVLKRQAWNPQERAAGGIVEQHPDDYEELDVGPGIITTHRRFFSTNPCVYPARIARIGWPQVPQSEGMFTHKLLKDPHLRFAFWGGKFDAPLVHHIGAARAGNGY